MIKITLVHDKYSRVNVAGIAYSAVLFMSAVIEILMYRNVKPGVKTHDIRHIDSKALSTRKTDEHLDVYEDKDIEI